jgi:hypothetical protein
MPTPVQLILGVAALVALGLLFLVGRRLANAWLRYRGTRIVTCPETRGRVAIEVDAPHAALSAASGRPRLRLESCTRWPERRACGQQCLAEVEAAPEACLLLNILGDWYRGRKCVFCGHVFGSLGRFDHRPGLVAPKGTLHDWSSFRPEQIIGVLASHEPVCWDCRVAEGFRREHPELVTDRPVRLGPPSSLA